MDLLCPIAVADASGAACSRRYDDAADVGSVRRVLHLTDEADAHRVIFLYGTGFAIDQRDLWRDATDGRKS